MTNTSWLPRFLRWMFAIFTVITLIVAAVIALIIVIDPKLPAGTHFGPMKIEILGQPGTFSMTGSSFAAALLQGNIYMRVDDPAALIEMLKHYGLPVILLNTLFFAGLFDLFRRLFRNVGRGLSFTKQSLRLVQIIGLSLLGFSLISVVTEAWFYHALYSYLSQHAVVWISKTPIHIPQSGQISISSSDGSPFGSPLFFSGLMVLALSEVFRQGLALKNDNDLTI